MNLAILCGRLGKDPDLSTTRSGTPKAELSLCTNDAKGNAEWHRVVAWGKTAENVAKYKRRGEEILVEGRVQTRSWDGKDGRKRYMTEVVAQKITFTRGGKRDEGERRPSEANSRGGDQWDSDEEIPF